MPGAKELPFFSCFTNIVVVSITYVTEEYKKNAKTHPLKVMLNSFQLLIIKVTNGQVARTSVTGRSVTDRAFT